MIKDFNVEIPEKLKGGKKAGDRSSLIVQDIEQFLNSGAQNAEIHVEKREGLEKYQVARKMASAYNTTLGRIGMGERCIAIIRGERLFLVYREDL